MSKEYDAYLCEHRANVRKAAYWILDNLGMGLLGLSERDTMGLLENLDSHDMSKYGPEEYDAYDAYFYGTPDEEAFDLAWLHHQHVNPHHWQHWVLIGDDDGVRALRMPIVHVIEMVADWWSFSWKSGDLTEVLSWYESHRDGMTLHEDTRRIVESILEGIRRRCVDDRMREAMETIGRLVSALADADAENAKLRELVKAFNWCTENFDLQCKCDSCPLGQSDKLTPECEVRMRELGIEAGE